MSIVEMSSDRSDVNETELVATNISVGTTAIEAKVGTNRLIARQVLTIENRGPQTVYHGPAGVTVATGISILKNQIVDFPIGDLGIFLIAASSGQNVIVQELA